jgi:hypothetical protein
MASSKASVLSRPKPVLVSIQLPSESHRKFGRFERRPQGFDWHWHKNHEKFDWHEADTTRMVAYVHFWEGRRVRLLALFNSSFEGNNRRAIDISEGDK